MLGAGWVQAGTAGTALDLKSSFVLDVIYGRPSLLPPVEQLLRKLRILLGGVKDSCSL